jgi:hypothetical protein
MKVVLIIAFLVSISLAQEACDDTCNPYTLSFCKPYIPATSFCYVAGSPYINPNNIESGVQTTASNETNYEEFSSTLPLAATNSCREFYVSTTCTTSFGLYVPPCDAQGNKAVPCFLSCMGGYMGCGLSEAMAEGICSRLSYASLYAALGDNNCYVSYPFPNSTRDSSMAN